MDKILVIKKIDRIRELLAEIEQGVRDFEGLKDDFRVLPAYIAPQLFEMRMEIERILRKENRKEIKKKSLKFD